MLLAKFSSKAGTSAWCGLDLWLVTSDGGLLTRVTFTDGGFGPGCIMESRLCIALSVMQLLSVTSSGLGEVDYLCFVELNVNVWANVLMFWAVWTMRRPVASSAADISTTMFIVIPSCSPVTHSVAH